jgi:hypothetical protein
MKEMSKFLIFLIFFFTLFHFSQSLKSSVRQESDMDKLIKQNSKMNKTLSQQLSQINQMNTTIVKLEEENKGMKKKLEEDLRMIEEKNKKLKSLGEGEGGGAMSIIKKEKEAEMHHSVIEVKGILQDLAQYHGFYEQIKMKMERERVMEGRINKKMEELSRGKEKILELKGEMDITYKQKVEGMSDKVDKIENRTIKNEKRLFNLEKEREKMKILYELNDIKHDTNANKDLCRERNSCNLCVEESLKCVWCSIERKCVPGTKLGADDGSCMNSFKFQQCDANLK